MTEAEPVTVGTAVIAYIEPHAGEARAFNRWYERDHFYAAAMAGPGRVRRRPVGRDARVQGRASGARRCSATPRAARTSRPTGCCRIAKRNGTSGPHASTRRHRPTACSPAATTSTPPSTDSATTRAPMMHPFAATALDHGFAGVIAVATTGEALAGRLKRSSVRTCRSRRRSIRSARSSPRPNRIRIDSCSGSARPIR